MKVILGMVGAWILIFVLTLHHNQVAANTPKPKHTPTAKHTMGPTPKPPKPTASPTPSPSPKPTSTPTSTPNPQASAFASESLDDLNNDSAFQNMMDEVCRRQARIEWAHDTDIDAGLAFSWEYSRDNNDSHHFTDYCRIRVHKDSVEAVDFPHDDVEVYV